MLQERDKGFFFILILRKILKTPTGLCATFAQGFFYFYSKAFCFLSVSLIDHCEIYISKGISARLLTPPYLNEVPRVKSLSLCKGGNKLSLKVRDCHLDQFEIERKRNKPFSILVCVRV